MDDCSPVNSPAEEDDEMEAATLMVVLELHPALLTEDEVIREVAEDPGDLVEQDTARVAVRELIGAGLLHQSGNLVLPTRAAVRIMELFGLIA